MIVLKVFLTLLLFVITIKSDVITHNDPDVINRIPKELKDAIDAAVSMQLDHVLSLHFDDNPWPHYNNEKIYYDPTALIEEDSNRTLHRQRRDTNGAVFSSWSEYDACTVKCGGGYQVRTRECFSGNCTGQKLVESRECGFLPCVPGTYVLDSMAISSRVPLAKAIDFKFFTIGQEVYFGFINQTMMTVLSIDPFTRQYEVYQTIPCVMGVAFDILNTHRRYFLVILEEAPTFFGSKVSSLYYFDMFMKKFRISEPVRFDVKDPSAVKSFDVFGLPFIAVVSKYNRRPSLNGQFKRALVCDKQRVTISCSENSLISIKNVFYGRMDQWECGGTIQPGFYPCIVPVAKDIVVRHCADKSECLLTGSAAWLSEGYVDLNCIRQFKYLTVSYTCLQLTRMSTPKFYKWDGIGLALVSGDNLFTYTAHDIEAFTIHNQQYLAVANFKNDQNQHHIDSEVYMYDVLLGRFSSLQKLRTDGAVDFEFFTIGRGLSIEYFLAVANHIKILPNGEKQYEVESIIYKWNWNVFVPFQCIKTNGARKWVAVSGDNGEFVLSVVNDFDVTYFYGYDGWRFYATKVQPKDEIFLHPQNMISFIENDQPKLLVYNENNNTLGHNNVFQLNFMKTFPKYELFEETLQKVQELNRTFQEIITPQVTSFNKTFNEKKDAIVFLDQDFNLTALKTFKTIEVVGDTIVDVASGNKFDLSPDDKNYENIQLNLRQSLLSNNRSLLTASEFLARTVTKSTEQVITGNNTFINHVTMEHLEVLGDVKVEGLINDVNISDIFTNAVMIDENCNITGLLNFENNLVVDANLDVKGPINGVHIDDVILTNTDDVIAGVKEFLSIESDEHVTIKGLLNDKNLTHVFRTDVPQNVTGRYSFNAKLNLKENLTTERSINGKDFEALKADAVFINRSNQNITSRKRFDKVYLKSNLNMKDLALINGIDVSSLVASRPHLNAQKEINGTVTFADKLTFKGPLIIKGLLDGIPASEIVFSTQDTIIKGMKTIRGHVTAHSTTHINGELNGLSISDILDTVSDQTVSGKMTFNSTSLHFEDDLDVVGTFNNVDVSKLYSSTMMHGKNQTITGHKTFVNVSVENMVIESCEQGCSMLQILQKLQENAVRNITKPTVVRGKKIFENALEVDGSLKVDGFLNGVKLPGQFILQNVSQNITGKNTFENITAGGNVYVDSINGVNITHLYEQATSNNKSATFENDVVFEDSVIFKGLLQVDGLVDGKKLPDDVILTYENRTFKNNIHFTNIVNVENLSLENMTTYGLIDGVNLTYLNSELVRHKSDQIVKGTKVFESHVSFAGDWDIPGLIDGVNITELNRNAMRLSNDQEITGRKTFRMNVDVSRQFNVSGLVDDVNLTDIKLNSLYKNKANQDVSKNIHFENVIINGNLTILELVNEENMTSLFEDALKKNGDQIIDGSYTVAYLNVTENFNVDGLVNNRNFSEEILLLNKSKQIIRGTKNFMEQLRVENLTVGLINGINFSDIVNRALYVDKDTVISAPIKFSNKTQFNNLTLHEFINNLNFSELINTAFLKINDQNISAPTNFSHVQFDSNVTIQGLLNSINLQLLEKELIYKCHGPNRDFISDTSFEKVTIDQDLTVQNASVSGLINKINITELETDIVTIFGNHTIYGSKSFKDFVHANTIGNIDSFNGFKYPEDFVLLTENATITGKKKFVNDLFILKDFDIAESKTINGIDVSEIARNLVLKSSNNTHIETPVVFQNNVFIHKNLDVGLLNGFNISEETLLLRDRNQNVTGKKTIHSMSLREDLYTKELINGIDLKRIQNESILLDQENNITGTINIIGDVIIKGNLWTNLIDGSNVTIKFTDLTQLSHLIEYDSVNYGTKYDAHKKMLQQITSVVGEIYQSLDYFSLWQNIYLPYKSISFDVINNNGDVIIVAGALQDLNGSKCINSSVYSSASGNFSKVSEIYGVPTRHVKLIPHNADAILLSSSATVNDGCFSTLDNDKEYVHGFRITNNYQTVYSYSLPAFGGKYIHVHTNNFNEEIGIFTNTFHKKTDTNCADQAVFKIVNGQINILLNISECNVLKSIVISTNQTHILAAILISSTERNEVSLILIPRDFGSPVVKNTILTHFAQDIISYSDEDGKYLVIVNTYDTSSQALVVSYTTPVEVYSITNDGYHSHYQSINAPAATFARHFTLGEYKYLALATMQQKVVIYKHRGISKWSEHLEVPVNSLVGLDDMKFWTDKDGMLFAAFLTPNLFDANFPSQIKVVKGELTTQADGKDVVNSISDILN